MKTTDPLMCEGIACPLRENCYRFHLYEKVENENAKVSLSLISTPYEHEKSRCAFYIEIERKPIY